jgi:hypothetical protein
MRSLAGTVTHKPLSPVSFRLLTWMTTSVTRGSSVWFCSTTGSSMLSPKFRKRGADGRTINGSRAVRLASAEPNCLPPASTATTITR